MGKNRARAGRKHPVLTAVAAVCIIAVGVYFMRSRASVSPPLMTAASYYTCDDGKTLFQDDDSHHLAPFDHDGQEAVQVFFIPGRPVGRTDSIWYLRKMTPAFKTQTEAMMGTMNSAPPKAGPGPAASPQSPFGGHLVKRPGDQKWLPIDSPKAAEILKLP